VTGDEEDSCPFAAATNSGVQPYLSFRFLSQAEKAPPTFMLSNAEGFWEVRNEALKTLTFST
jgi:hypothetical protein